MTLATLLGIAIMLTICTIGLVITTFAYVGNNEYALDGPSAAITLGLGLISFASFVATVVSYFAIFHFMM